ncbi:MAG: ERCC4 domain-containing protein [Candidatus Bathyarchaeia archaeon]|nr:heavy metal resistance protein CzcA [Candidatus Bathyarchaeota archaeon A05DMB-4]MDH7595691.1 ERCC4 domain-containing protein [Candidatus Bathyarchaeota archaeon]
MKEGTLRVIVDEREKNSRVPRFLKNLGLQVEPRLLEVADYVVSPECAIERKQESDFLKSLYSGRLFDQIRRLSERYFRPVLIVEGELPLTVKRMEKPGAFWGALTSLMFMYNVNVFFTPDAEQTAQLIHSLAKRKNKIPPSIPFVHKKPKSTSIEKTQVHLVASLPGLGPVLAKRLLEHFQSVRKVFAASVAELSTVKGVGRTKAEKIVKTLDAPYKPEVNKGRQMLLS